MAIQKQSPRQPDNTDVGVGRLVRVERIGRGLSQAELGKRIGVSLQQVCHYEAGVDRISMGRLTRIAKALGVDVLYLLSASQRAAPVIAASNLKQRANLAEGARMLGLIGAMRLLKAFAAIPSKPTSLRESIVKVIEGTAAAGHAGGRAKPRSR